MVLPEDSTPVLKHAVLMFCHGRSFSDIPLSVILVTSSVLRSFENSGSYLVISMSLG